MNSHAGKRSAVGKRGIDNGGSDAGIVACFDIAGQALFTSISAA